MNVKMRGEQTKNIFTSCPLFNPSSSSDSGRDYFFTAKFLILSL